MRRTTEHSNLRVIWSVITVVFFVLVTLAGGGVVVYNWIQDVNTDRITTKFRLDLIEKRNAEADRAERWDRNQRRK